MRAVGYRQPLPIDAPEALVDLELPDPSPPAATSWSRSAPSR